MASSTHAANERSFRRADAFAFSAIDGRIETDSGSFFSVRYDTFYLLPCAGRTCPDSPKVCPAFLWIVIVT